MSDVFGMLSVYYKALNDPYKHVESISIAYVDKLFCETDYIVHLNVFKRDYIDPLKACEGYIVSLKAYRAPRWSRQGGSRKAGILLNTFKSVCNKF